MMTFDALLKGAWHAGNGRETLSAAEVASSVSKLSNELTQALRYYRVKCDKLFVFLIRNNFEGMHSYFIASRLKLRAMLLNVGDIHLLSGAINPQHIAAVVLLSPGGIRFNGRTIKIQLDALRLNRDNARPCTCPQQITGLNMAQFFFMTSGTTSTPKLVQYRESVLVENAAVVVQYLALHPRDKTLCFFPVQYMYGLSSMLCAFISNSTIVFENFQLCLVADLIEDNCITTLPLIGDFMIPLSKILEARRIRVTRILNASDRLLAVQSSAILPCCETLWNNFGQTESGPRLFCLSIRSRADITERTRYGVVAPGFPAMPGIRTELRDTDSGSNKEMFYHTPFSSEGYVDRDFTLLPAPRWQKSGDLFEVGSDGCHYWLSRTVSEFKFNGRFVPVQRISESILRETGVRHFFSRSESGTINVNVEESAGEPTLNVIRRLLADRWYFYPCTLTPVADFPLTPSGKIKLVSGT